MKIKQVTFEQLDLKLSEPYTIAYETIAHTTNFILKIVTSSGLTGFGCAAPDVVVTLESPAQAKESIENILIPFLLGKNAMMSVQILEELKTLLPTSSSVLAMTDMALLDLKSRKMDVPLYQFLGGYRHSIPTSMTIGILTVEDTLNAAAAYYKQGFFILKVKGGLSVDEDVEKMIRIRELYPDMVLRFDGNQGYSVEQALRFLKQAKAAKIELFEQPTAVGKDHNMGQITHRTATPVMADESLKNLEDAFRLAQNSRINMVNIKLMKVGGIREAMHINSVAKSAGFEAMVGCIDECALGISAGLHFALSRANIKYADLDGHLDILDDPFSGIFSLKKGVLYPSEAPGLGVL